MASVGRCGVNQGVAWEDGVEFLGTLDEPGSDNKDNRTSTNKFGTQTDLPYLL